MTPKPETAVRQKSFSRVFRKVLVSTSKGSLVPSMVRVGMLRLAGVKFLDPQSAFVGDAVYFDDLRPDLITIGRRCLITSGVKFLTHFFDATHQGNEEWPFNFASGRIQIGDFVFVGTGSVFVEPVVVGDWAIIGANTVITKDVPKGAIFCGNPGKVIGFRKGFSKEQ